MVTWFPAVCVINENICVSLDRNTEYMFSISFGKHHDEKKENNLLTLIIKM